MTQAHALLQLRKTLLTHRSDLREKLAGELASLRDFKTDNCTGDSADMAFETSSDALSSQLAALDAGRLKQIDGALGRLQQGTYRICEGGSANCQKRISTARLKAIPGTTLCINCERELEKNSDRPDRAMRNWDEVFAAQASTEDRCIDLAKLEMNLSGNRGI